MKDKTIQTKVKGTVLYTVISVLMILVVFLMGTLALAATASNRAYGNYQKEQTEATARAVLDSVVQAINEDTSNNGIKSKMKALPVGSTPMTVQVTGSDGMSETVTIKNTGTRTVYSPTQEAWVSGTIYEVSTTVDKTLADTTYSAFIVDEAVVATGGGGGGGAFVSLGGIGGKIGTAGFTSGGTEIGIGGTGNESYSIDNTAVQMVPFYLNGNLTTSSQCTVYFNKLGKNQFYAITGNLTINNTFAFDYDDTFQWDNNTGVAYNEVPCMYVGKTLRVASNTVELGSTTVPLNIYVGGIETDINFYVHGDIYAFDENGVCNFTSGQGTTILYNWISKTIKQPDGADKTINYGNLYSKGEVNFSVTNNNHEIRGELRVEKDVTISGSKAVTVGSADATGNVVVGDTLWVKGGTTLNCANIYADTLICDGTINCAGNVKANHVYGGGTLNAASLECLGTTVEKTEVIREWYTDFTYSVVTINERVNSWDPSNYAYDYSVTKHVTTIINGVETTVEETLTGVSDTVSLYTWDNPNTMEGYLAAGKDANFNKYSDTNVYETTTVYPPFNHQAAMEAGTVPTVNIIGSATGVDVKYGVIYPEEYEKDQITNKIIEAPKKDTYTNYPTTIEKLNDTITLLNTNYTDNYDYQVTVYGDDEAIPTKIETSCVLTGTATQNIYIKPVGPTVIVVDNFSMQDGKSIIIDDNGGKVYFFVRNTNGNNASDFNVSGGSIVTTDYIKQIYGREFTEAEILNTNFKQMLSNSMTSALTIEKLQAVGSDEFPDVYIYGETGSSMTIGNNSFLTANVRAPLMNFSQATSSTLKQGITYVEDGNPNNITTDYASGTNVGVIGQLICNRIDVANEWGLIYVTTEVSVSMCDSSCTACGGTKNCPCTCTDASCTCCSSHGGGGGGGTGKYTVLYYNYY